MTTKMFVKVYDTRSGDPERDNRARMMNKALNDSCRRGVFKVQTPRGRRRRKQIMSAEYPRYVRLVAMVGEEIALRARPGRFIPAWLPDPDDARDEPACRSGHEEYGRADWQPPLIHPMLPANLGRREVSNVVPSL